MNSFSFFIINIIVNSLLVFFTTLLLIEILIKIFRVQFGRCTSYLRMIPIFKMVLDPFLYDFSKWSYNQGVNPINCEEGTRQLSIAIGSLNPINDWLVLPFRSEIQLTTKGGMTFTIADLISYLVPTFLLNTFVTIFLLLTTLFFLKRIRDLFFYLREFNSFKSLKCSSGRKIESDKLNKFIKRNSLKILTSSNFEGSPFVGGFLSFTIYFPEKLYCILSQKEYEATIAHEIEHIRHKDNLVRVVLIIIGSVFWWIPLKRLRRCVEKGQEVGCDFHCQKRGVDPIDLASALYLSAKHRSEAVPFFSYSLVKANEIYERVNYLLEPSRQKFKKIRFILTASAVSVAFFGILLGRYWIF